MKKHAYALLFTLLFGVLAFAHGDKKHVMGTVEKITPDSVVVKMKDGNSVVVKLVSSTVFLRHTNSAKTTAGSDQTAADQPAKASDLAVGDLVVIHATPKDGGLEANEVKFSVPSSAKSASSSPSTP